MEAKTIVDAYEARVEEIEASVISLIRELKEEADRITEEAERVYAETGNREAALAIDEGAKRITGLGGLVDRLKTIGQGGRI